MRVPPPNPDLLHFLEAYPSGITHLVLELRRLVLTAAPTANELVYDAYNAVAIAYTFTSSFRTGFCHIAAYAQHVNLGFNQGAQLPDPDRVLQGTGKSIRHLKVKTAADLESPHLRHFLSLALEIAPPNSLPHPKPRSITKSISPVKRRPTRK